MNPITEPPVKGLGETKMRTMVRAIMAILACGMLGGIYGAIAGAIYGFLLLVTDPSNRNYAAAGFIMGAIYGTISGFIAGSIGGGIGGPVGWGIGGFIGGFSVAACCHSILPSIIAVILPGIIGGVICVAIGWAIKRGSVGPLLPLLLPVELLMTVLTMLKSPHTKWSLWKRSIVGFAVALVSSAVSIAVLLLLDKIGMSLLL